MLFAVADARGREHAAARFAQLIAVAGLPRARSAYKSVVMGAWGSHGQLTHCLPEAGSSENGARPCFIEGTFDLSRRSRDPVGKMTPYSDVTALREAKGDFALVAGARDGFVLASGRAGGYRPIYVATDASSVVACTHLQWLLHVLPSRPALDADYFAAELAWRPIVDPPPSPYRGVSCVPMHEAWFVRPGHPPERSSTFAPYKGAEDSRNDEERAGCLRDALTGAVRRACGGSRCVGVLGGGGLDSSGILSIAHSLRKAGLLDRVEALAFDFATYKGDDRPFMKALSDYLGIMPQWITPRDAAFGLPQFTLDAAPVCHPSSSFSRAAFRRARHLGANVVLTGVGGDDVLEGNAGALAELAAQGSWLSALQQASRLRGRWVGALPRIRAYLLRPLLAQWEPAQSRRFRRKLAARRDTAWAGPRLHRFVRDHEERAVRSSALCEGPAQRYERLARAPFLARLAVLRGHEEAEVGHVRRDPFFDDEVLRTVASFPPLTLLQGDFFRGLYRTSLEGLVPERVRLRETKADLEPAFVAMVRAVGGFSIFDPLAKMSHLADLGLIEPRAFRERFDEFSRLAGGPAVTFFPVWFALALEAFLRGRAAETSGSFS